MEARSSEHQHSAQSAWKPAPQGHWPFAPHHTINSVKPGSPEALRNTQPTLVGNQPLLNPVGCPGGELLRFGVESQLT